MIRKARHCALLGALAGLAAVAPGAAAAVEGTPEAAVQDSPGVPFLAKLVARGFFAALLGGDVEAALPLCAARVDFDGTTAAGADAVRARLMQVSARARTSQLRLRRLVVLSRAEMSRRFGAPPARVRRTARRGQYFALASFGGRGAVAVLSRAGRFFRVMALTD